MNINDLINEIKNSDKMFDGIECYKNEAIKLIEQLSDKQQISEEDIDNIFIRIQAKNLKKPMSFEEMRNIVKEYLKPQPPKENCKVCKNIHKKFPLKYHDNTEGAGYTYQLIDCVCCPECGKKLSEVKDD